MERVESTLDNCLHRTAIAMPDRIFLICAGRAVTFAEADAFVSDFAAALLAHGAGRGTRVALLMPSIAEFALYLLACARIGAIAIPLNTRYTGAELADLLGRSRSDLLVAVEGSPDQHLLDTLERTVPAAQLPSMLRFADPAPGATQIIPPGGPRASAADLDAARAAVDVHDPAIVVYTSGTSGSPKGAVHDHRILRNCANIVRAFRILPDDRILGHMPLYHVAGLCAAIMPAILTGATLVLVRRWDADAVVNLIAREGVTIFGGIPTHFIDLLEAVDRNGQDVVSLKAAWIGGATISPELAQRAKSRLGLRSLQAIYGMTETTSTTTLSGYDDDIAIVCQNKGRPIGDFEVAVVDPNTGAPQPVDLVGEVRVRGHIVMAGYLDDPAATAAAITPDGWFKTGDLGRFDAKGYLQIIGRLKDVFRVGGSTVSPAEIERVLESHAAIRQAIVVGVADARLGEVGFAFVQPAAQGVSRDVIDAHVRAHLAGYKRPRFIDFIDDFPMTTTGKIQREVLRARAAEIVTTLQAGTANAA